MKHTIRRGAWPLAMALAGCCGHAAAAGLTVSAENIRNSTGTIRFEVDGSAAAWNDKEKPAATADVPAAPGSVSYTFKDLPPGTYAVSVFHDENNNGKLDVSLFGTPKEGVGFSNNPDLRRLPTFEESRFAVPDGGVSISVRLKYY